MSKDRTSFTFSVGISVIKTIFRYAESFMTTLYYVAESILNVLAMCFIKSALIVTDGSYMHVWTSLIY